MARLREYAKLFAGFATCETIGHWWIGILGTDLLPIDVGLFTLTETVNTVAMIAWPLVLIALFHLAWPRQEQPKLKSSGYSVSQRIRRATPQ